jgi:hypothetical protein
MKQISLTLLPHPLYILDDFNWRFWKLISTFVTFMSLLERFDDDGRTKIYVSSGIGLRIYIVKCFLEK